MGEHVIIRQNSLFETEILALDPHDPEAQEFQPVVHAQELTPYGMLLAGLGACTAIVLHTYAQHHGVELDEVEMHLTYDRVYAEDCQDCEIPREYKEQIDEEMTLTGGLTVEEKSKLLLISRHCPIHQMLVHGIEVQSRLAPEEGRDSNRIP